MMHFDRHILKTDEELISRLLKEWKLYIGSFYNEDIIEEIIKNKKNEKEYIYQADKPAGHSYNRNFEEIETNYIKVILDNNFNLLTAYPEAKLGLKTGKIYDFQKNKELLIKENPEYEDQFTNLLWDYFIKLKEELNYEIRYNFIHKHPKIEIFYKEYKITINDRLEANILNTITSKKISFDLDINNISKSINDEFMKHSKIKPTIEFLL